MICDERTLSSRLNRKVFFTSHSLRCYFSVTKNVIKINEKKRVFFSQKLSMSDLQVMSQLYS